MRLEGNRLFISRRNLLTLLAKLDGAPEESKCTIMYYDPDLKPHFLTAEEDGVHYAHPSREGVAPGLMHPDTEERIIKS